MKNSGDTIGNCSTVSQTTAPQRILPTSGTSFISVRNTVHGFYLHRHILDIINTILSF